MDNSWTFFTIFYHFWQFLQFWHYFLPILTNCSEMKTLNNSDLTIDNWHYSQFLQCFGQKAWFVIRPKAQSQTFSQIGWLPFMTTQFSEVENWHCQSRHPGDIQYPAFASISHNKIEIYPCPVLLSQNKLIFTNIHILSFLTSSSVMLFTKWTQSSRYHWGRCPNTVMDLIFSKISNTMFRLLENKNGLQKSCTINRDILNKMEIFSILKRPTLRW